jgi:hypothetical protein
LKPQVQRDGITLSALLGEEFGVDVKSKLLISFENDRREHESRLSSDVDDDEQIRFAGEELSMTNSEGSMSFSSNDVHESLPREGEGDFRLVSNSGTKLVKHRSRYWLTLFCRSPSIVCWG